MKLLCLKQMFSESRKRAWLQLYLLILTHLTLLPKSPRKSWIFDYCSPESLSAKMPPQQDHKSSTMKSELFLPGKVWAAFICAAKQCHGARRAGGAQGQFFTCDINRAEKRRREERALKEKKLVCFDESALTMTLTMETAFHCGHAPCLHPQYHL